jgi:ubiquitin carboxyl-terminal hydrolase 4/11/15
VATLTKHDFFSRREDSEVSDTTTEPELLGLNGSDSSSANESKVTAHSVEGEDDIVDVTMKDASDPNASNQATPGAHKYA